MATIFANAMTKLESTAIVADLYIGRKRNCVMGAAHATARLGSAFFGDSHFGASGQ
jgi:hypothetical protein